MKPSRSAFITDRGGRSFQEALSDSDVDRTHIMISSARGEPLGRGFLNRREIALRQLHTGRRYILFEVLAAFGAWNRNNIVALASVRLRYENR